MYHGLWWWWLCLVTLIDKLNDDRPGSGAPRFIIISILSKLKVRGSALYRLINELQYE